MIYSAPFFPTATLSVATEVPVDRLVATDRKAKVALSPTDTAALMARESVPSSLMLRGMSVDEALPLLANYLDRAYRAHHASVVVIHGRGEPALYHPPYLFHT